MVLVRWQPTTTLSSPEVLADAELEFFVTLAVFVADDLEEMLLLVVTVKQS